jgi:tetratricopeptide (TPR) repeat protein
MLIETKTLVGRRGSYRLIKAIERARIPATVQAIIASRIDRLSSEDKRLLQAAAVIGTEVPLTLLQAIADQTDESVHRSLAHLQAAEFLFEAQLFPEVEYTFRHALSHQVTYNGLTHDRRRILHARIVETLEVSDQAQRSENVERLAQHAFGGELWEKAAKYLSQAGTRALARSAHREAVQYFEHALTSLGHLPQQRELQELSVDVRLGLRSSLFPLGQVEAGLQHLQNADEIATGLGDKPRLALISAYMSEHHRLTGHSRDAIASALKVEAIANELDEVSLAVAAKYYLGTAYFTAGDHVQAGTHLENTIQLLGGELGRERFGLAGFPVVMARVFRVWGLAERGNFDQGIAVGHEAVQLAQTLNHPYSLAFACRGIGHVYGIMGDFRHAIPFLEQGIVLCREWNLKFIAPTLTEMLGYVHTLSGRRAEGIELLEQALSAGEAIGFKMFLTPMIIHLGEARLLLGEPATARELAQRAITQARGDGQRSQEAWASRLLGEIEASNAEASRDSAEAHFRHAMALSEELGLRPLNAHCHLGLGKLARLTGQCAKAREHFAIATAMWREMDVRFWFEQAEAEMRQLH